jgi:general secretion pathway protein F
MSKLFKFVVVDPSGKTIKGKLEADSEAQARAQLEQQDGVVLQLAVLQTQTSANHQLWARSPLKGEALATWTLQLATLLEAQLPLERALVSLRDELTQPKQVHLMQSIQSDVQGGGAFSEALARHPHVFEPSYVAVVAAGEHSGQLGRVLKFQAETLLAQENLKNRLLASATYPMIVLVLAAVILLFLMTYVVPQIASVFSQSKQSLPTLTVVMLKLSDWTGSYGLWAALGVVLGAVVLLRMRRHPSGRQWVDSRILALPLLGKLLNEFFAARFASTLAMLLHAGVPMMKAMQTAANVVSNQHLRLQILACTSLVREGAPLGAALQTKTSLPKLLVTFVKLGEQTGQLPQMLQSVSHQLSENMQRRTSKLISILEPALIVLMGVVVTLIVLAVLMPIIQMNELVG